LQAFKGHSQSPIRKQLWHPMCIHSGVCSIRQTKNWRINNMAKKLKKATKLEATKPLTVMLRADR
jgi:hypothetical protein